ncbi:MAG: hypothetical protein ACI4UK_02040 [Floccifex sp.]
MATSKEYFMFIWQQLQEIEDISYKQMMAEYIIYYQNNIAAYVYDNTFFVKDIPSVLKMCPSAKKMPPYPGAKNMVVIEQVEDTQFLKELFENMKEEIIDFKIKRVLKSDFPLILEKYNMKQCSKIYRVYVQSNEIGICILKENDIFLDLDETYKGIYQRVMKEIKEKNHVTN